MRTTMNDTVLRRLRQATAMVSVAMVGACAGDAPSDVRITAPAVAALAKDVDLGSCDSLRVPAGNKQSHHVYATGYQIYRWNGTRWGFVAPSATLSADAAFNSTVGTHYAGPTWESNSGSKVVGAVQKRCPSPIGSIPWLLLGAASSSGPGVFDGTTFIQRVNTTGGVAPSAPGQAVGEVANVYYTAEYYFYRAQ
jgi:hypothetical protein